ncbi:hypothetical protein ILUMI_24070 [Ignelater luminosus]|uniref:Uncharacterized protein n=1 Tax=Ignelater luminosus TaxID=2038154 RepID=A0A8K0CCP1_IGNLU|nr:hypothetical protein ILUMI_24070 [Ignelater luminosus]
MNRKSQSGNLAADTEKSFDDIEEAEPNTKIELTQPTEPTPGPSTENTEKRGCPASAIVGQSTPETANIETRPVKEVRLDNVGHLPVLYNNKNALRCKKPGCKGKSHLCDKCQVHLYVDKQQNYFFDYYTK